MAERLPLSSNILVVVDCLSHQVLRGLDEAVIAFIINSYADKTLQICILGNEIYLLKVDVFYPAWVNHFHEMILYILNILYMLFIIILMFICSKNVIVKLSRHPHITFFMRMSLSLHSYNHINTKVQSRRLLGPSNVSARFT